MPARRCGPGPAAPGTVGATLRGYRVVLAAGARVVPVNVSGDRAVVCAGFALNAPLVPELQESDDSPPIAARPVIPLPTDTAARDRVNHARNDLRTRLTNRDAPIDLVAIGR